MQTSPPSSRRRLYSIPQAAHELGVGKTSVPGVDQEDKIHAIKLGLRCTFIAAEEIEPITAHGIAR